MKFPSKIVFLVNVGMICSRERGDIMTSKIEGVPVTDGSFESMRHPEYVDSMFEKGTSLILHAVSGELAVYKSGESEAGCPEVFEDDIKNLLDEGAISVEYDETHEYFDQSKLSDAK